MIHIGTQTFGLGKELTNDLIGTLHMLYDVGFDAIEPFVLFNEKQGKISETFGHTIRFLRHYLCLRS